MNVLGIETSCDETAAAIVSTTNDAARPWIARSNVIASQVAIHREWGGVVPEIASRQHVRDICGVVERALDDAGTDWNDVDALAVTQGPGLVGSLLVGVSFAKAAAAALGKPIVAVHHLAGHIESIVLEHGAIPLPAAVLVVSGGHTSLYLVPEPGVYRLAGRTRDDAAGEAYDKIAKLLGPNEPANFAMAAAYDGMRVIYRMIEAQKGDKFDPEAALAAAKGFAWDSPRGRVSIDPDTRNIIQNVYIRKVESKDGKLFNAVVDTFPAIKDPWEILNKK